MTRPGRHARPSSEALRASARGAVRRAPGSPRARRLRHPASLALGLLVACSSGTQVVPLRSNRPGVAQYRIQCVKHIDRCRAAAAEACGGAYQVVHTSGHRVEPKRIDTGPGPSSTGPSLARPSWAGEMVIECAERAAPDRALPAPAPPPAPERACVPGVTQLCLGPAACRGAQACLPDGQGFGPCDCGSVEVPEEPEPPTLDAGAAPAEP